jgi:hypothetical protein
MMRFYSRQHRFYCGIDLHARTLSLCLLDHAGHTVLEQTIAADGPTFLATIAPFRDDLVVCCECLFCWYWLADLCHEHDLAFVLGHALYMKAIHGGKSKNDKIDAAKIARLLRGGNIPYGYVYPKGMRETRDLLRRPSWNRDRPCPTASPTFSMAGAVARVSFWGVARKATTGTRRRPCRPRAEPRLAVWPSRSAGAVARNRTVQRRASVVNRSARAAWRKQKLPIFIVRLLTSEDI